MIEFVLDDSDWLVLSLPFLILLKLFSYERSKDVETGILNTFT